MSLNYCEKNPLKCKEHCFHDAKWAVRGRALQVCCWCGLRVNIPLPPKRHGKHRPKVESNK